MPLANVKELVRLLQPHVTGFSLGFQKNNKHGDKVVCGGRISRINDLSEWTTENKSKLVYLTIDDGVGETLVVVPKRIWEQESFKKDDIILVDGVLFLLDKDSVFESKIPGTKVRVERKDEPLRVLVKTIRAIPEVEEAEA